MSTTEQVDQTIQNIVSVAENISETARSSLTEILQSVEMGNGEAQNNDQNNNASQEKTWGEKYNDALEAQMRERSEVLNNRPISDKELNEILTRQREVMEKIISQR